MSDKKRVDVALVERGLAPEQLADRIEEIAGDKESSHVG